MQPEEQYLAFLSLKFLLPKLVDAKRLVDPALRERRAPSAAIRRRRTPCFAGIWPTTAPSWPSSKGRRRRDRGEIKAAAIRPSTPSGRSDAVLMPPT